MRNEDLEKLVAKLHRRLKIIPELDKSFLSKALQAVNSLNDPEVDKKLKALLQRFK